MDRLLAENGKDLTYLQTYGKDWPIKGNLLYMAANHSLFSCVEYLIDVHGFDVNTSDGRFGSPLGAIVCRDRPDIRDQRWDYSQQDEMTIDVLQRRGAKICQIGGGYESLLHLAVSEGHLPAVCKLLQMDDDVLKIGGSSGIIIHEATISFHSTYNRCKVLRLLLDRSSELVLERVNGNLPLEAAAELYYPLPMLLILDSMRNLGVLDQIDYLKVLRNTVLCQTPFFAKAGLMMGFVLRQLGELISHDQIKIVSQEALAYETDEGIDCWREGDIVGPSNATREIQSKGKILQEYQEYAENFTTHPPPGKLRDAMDQGNALLLHFLVSRYDYSKAIQELREVVEIAMHQQPYSTVCESKNFYYHLRL